MPESGPVICLGAPGRNQIGSVGQPPPHQHLRVNSRGKLCIHGPHHPGETGGKGCAEEARRAFERALEIDETVLDGRAHVWLGILQHEVPGWPVGFGDEDNARHSRERDLELYPNGIDSKYISTSSDRIASIPQKSACD